MTIDTVQKARSSSPRSVRVTILVTPAEAEMLRVAANGLPFEGNISYLIRSIIQDTLGKAGKLTPAARE